MVEKEVKEQEQSVNYAMLSLFQYVASILVILVHCQRLFPNEILHFTQKSMFGRMAVPFFLISSAFMLKSSLAKKKSMRTYVSRILKQYIFWSIFYLPYALIYFWSLPVEKYYAPFALIAGFLYIGLCYQLWYIPAFLLGLWIVHYLYKKIGPKWAVVVSLFLYLLGSIETYYTYFANTWPTHLYDVYSRIFFSTRNGLFYAPIFILFGYLLYDYWNSDFFKKDTGKKFLLASTLLALDGWLVFVNQGIDKNFFLALLPFSLFLVNGVLRTEIGKKRNLYHLKELSVLYFFLHPIFIESSFYLLRETNISKWNKGQIVFVLTIVLTHLTSEIILKFRKSVFARQKNGNKTV